MTDKIVVTGASGWLATEFVEGLIDNSSELNNLILLGRKPTTLVFSNGFQIEQGDYSNNEINFEIQGLVHLAFLTMGRIHESSVEAYKQENLNVTKRAVELIRENKPKWVITVSSGAAGLYKDADEQTPLHIYGGCKVYEEDQISQACEEVGAIFVCGRLWGALGEFMPVNTKYAVSDFIVSALTLGKIQIKNPMTVYRRYVDAGDFMKVLYKSAALGISGVLESGGRLTTLTELATLISEEIGGVDVSKPASTGEVDKTYLPINSQYEDRAAQLELRLNEFSTTLRATIESHHKSIRLGLLK